MLITRNQNCASFSSVVEGRKGVPLCEAVYYLLTHIISNKVPEFQNQIGFSQAISSWAVLYGIPFWRWRTVWVSKNFFVCYAQEKPEKLL